ncbi:methyltransferase [Amylocarpus encephaloides]|uniref:Methyltransferase n=1 Tax=Amylocarpus encephaloides TaxID=45428 RepID=A0A9P7YNN7_9HELO|nr:methyltransferase [Amylocarpus encephaloides]
MDTRATTGFQNASHYDKHRPSYFPEAVESLLSHLKLNGVKNAQVIDLASGTGKFTELLARREEDYEIIAIEPHEEMREQLAKKALKRVEVRDGGAVNMNIEDDWGDGLIAAQAFHWFATREALREIHRVLKPGASLGLIWNIEDYNAPLEWECRSKWEQTLKDIINSFEDGHPRFRHLVWKQAFEKQTETTPLQTLKDTFSSNFPDFSLPIGEEDIHWTVYLSDEAIWDRYRSLSMIANAKGERLEEVKKEVFEALKGDEVERNSAGEVTLHGRTHLVWTSRV